MKKNGNIKAFIGFIVLILVILVLVLAYDRFRDRPTDTMQPARETDEQAMMGEETPDPEGRIIVGVPRPLENTDLAYLYDDQTNDLMKFDQPEGWRVNEINRQPEAGFEPVLNDEAATRFVMGDRWNVVLRDHNGAPYQNPSFIGMVDENTVAIEAERDERFVLFVRSGGSITENYELPDLYKVHGIYGNAVWITTALSGNGLEAEPQGPAHVIRVDADGNESLISEDQVIDSLVAHESGSFAYRFTDGSYKARRGNFLWEGTGTPLYWINEDELLINQGRELKRVNLTQSAQDTIGEMEAAASVADRVELIPE